MDPSQVLVGLTLWLTVYFDGVPVRCLADTGSAVTVLSQTAAAKIGTLGPASGRLDVMREGGRRVPGVRHTIPHVGTGYLGWERVTALVVPDADSMFPCILGADLLAQQDITIRWGRGQVYLAAAPSD